MSALGNKAIQTFKAYPFSVAAYIFTMIPWVMVYVGSIRMALDPAPLGANDYRGEGLVYGSILALLLASILLIVTVINLLFQRDKGFYIKLIALVIASNLVLYGIGIII